MQFASKLARREGGAKNPDLTIFSASWRIFCAQNAPKCICGWAALNPAGELTALPRPSSCPSLKTLSPLLVFTSHFGPRTAVLQALHLRGDDSAHWGEGIDTPEAITL